MDDLLPVLEELALVVGAIDGVLYAVRFALRVRRKAVEPSGELMGKKAFMLWTWVVFFPLLLATTLMTAVVLLTTRNVWLSFLTLALGSGLTVFVWLIWAIVPVVAEDLRKKLEP